MRFGQETMARKHEKKDKRQARLPLENSMFLCVHLSLGCGPLLSQWAPFISLHLCPSQGYRVHLVFEVVPCVSLHLSPSACPSRFYAFVSMFELPCPFGFL